MNVVKRKHDLLKRRAHRTRTRITGTTERPRLSVFRSAKHINAQLIDDSIGKTIASSSDAALKSDAKPLERAKLVGADLAKKAVAAGVKKAVFDRGGYKYHGRVKAVAEGAREGGLEF